MKFRLAIFFLCVSFAPLAQSSQESESSCTTVFSLEERDLLVTAIRGVGDFIRANEGNLDDTFIQELRSDLDEIGSEQISLLLRSSNTLQFIRGFIFQMGLALRYLEFAEFNEIVDGLYELGYLFDHARLSESDLGLIRVLLERTQELVPSVMEDPKAIRLVWKKFLRFYFECLIAPMMKEWCSNREFGNHGYRFVDGDLHVLSGHKDRDIFSADLVLRYRFVSELEIELVVDEFDRSTHGQYKHIRIRFSKKEYLRSFLNELLAMRRLSQSRIRPASRHAHEERHSRWHTSRRETPRGERQASSLDEIETKDATKARELHLEQLRLRRDRVLTSPRSPRMTTDGTGLTPRRPSETDLPVPRLRLRLPSTPSVSSDEVLEEPRSAPREEKKDKEDKGKEKEKRKKKVEEKRERYLRTNTEPVLPRRSLVPSIDPGEAPQPSRADTQPALNPGGQPPPPPARARRLERMRTRSVAVPAVKPYINQ